MKITKRQLRRIIAEELEQAHPTGDLGISVAAAKFPVTIRYNQRSELVYNQDALDSLIDYLVDNGIKYSIDETGDIEPEQIPAGEEIEQLGESKKKLKFFIRDVLLGKRGR